ncbi:uncharacterized protein N0V89_006704 [Didymosphaeria variabile]|uniref:Uncharacterized protein n=1 Tax=Didymosphaeria variabile TaxID=1932322 RepID=A0A9W8XHV2_9PLEO|nr:uncharacterized protein N0V89_006704 [Didymosphaeria variabile]KAJ4351364.1 hypothetical protein N0V89_006704 [Didymosphaeria variabile]
MARQSDDPASVEVADKRTALRALLQSHSLIRKALDTAAQSEQNVQSKCAGAAAYVSANPGTVQCFVHRAYITALNDEAAAMATRVAALEKGDEAMAKQIEALKDWFKERGVDLDEVKDAVGSD